MSCLGKEFIGPNSNSTMAVGGNRSATRIEEGLKLLPQDIDYLFGRIELYGASGSLTRSSDGYRFQHLPTPSEPWLQIYAQDDYSGVDSRNKLVYARYK